MATTITRRTIIENIIEGITKIRIRRGLASTIPPATKDKQGEPLFTLDSNDLYINNGLENVLIGGKTALKNKLDTVVSPSILYGTDLLGEQKTYNLDSIPSMEQVNGKIDKTNTDNKLYGLYNENIQEIIDFKLYHRTDFTIDQLLDGAIINRISFPINPVYDLKGKPIIDWSFNTPNSGIKKIRFTPISISMVNENGTPANDGLNPNNIEGILFSTLWNNFNNFGIKTQIINDYFTIIFPKGTTLKMPSKLDDIGIGIFDAEFYPDKGLITKETFLSLNPVDIDPNNYYSTEEIETNGIWINGKKIYRKTFIGETNITNPMDYIEILPSVGTIINSYGELYFDETMIFNIPASIPLPQGIVYFGVLKSNNILYLYEHCLTPIDNVKYSITIEYTKL
jgi:hypothetical protein